MLFSKKTPAAGGDAFAQFDAAWCYNGNGYILNDTGTSLDVRIGASGSVITLAASALLPIKLVNSMAELYVRRTDQSTTQVTVEAQVGTGSAGGGGSTADMAVIAAASTAVHNTDPAAHLNIVRRTLTDNLTLTAADLPEQRITPDADRDVILPTEATAQWQFKLCHAGASYNLTIKRAGGTVVGILIPGSPLVVAWDGTAIGLC